MSEPGKEFDFTNDDFDFIRNQIFKITGISMGDHKKNMVYSRLARRIRVLGQKTVSEYCDFIVSPEGKDEIGNFINAVTTNLTKFFREVHHFDHLETKAIPEAVRRNFSSKSLRLWSAGCSSGMEPYSMSMVLNRVMPDIKSWDAKILATDIDTNMLNTGSSGIYRPEDAENIPAKYKKYINIDKKNNELVMSDEIKKNIFFKQLNLMHKFPMKKKLDIIFCRNVVIYFNKETQKVLFDKIANVLVDGGIIYIGHSENLHRVSERFEHLGNTIYRKIK